LKATIEAGHVVRQSRDCKGNRREAARRAREANRLINTMLQASKLRRKTTGLDTGRASRRPSQRMQTSQEASNAQGSSEAALAAGLSLAKCPVLVQSGAIPREYQHKRRSGCENGCDTLEYGSQTANDGGQGCCGPWLAVRRTAAADGGLRSGLLTRPRSPSRPNQLAGEFGAMLKTAAASGAAIQAASTSAAKVQDSMTEAIKYAMQAGKISSVLLQSVAEAGATEAEGATTLEGVQAAVKKVSSVDDSAAVLAASVELTGGSLSSGVRDIVTVNETTAETKRVKAATAEALRRANAAVAKLSVALGITQPPREPTVTELPVNPVTSVPVKTPDPATVTPIVTATTPAAAVTKNSETNFVECPTSKALPYRSDDQSFAESGGPYPDPNPKAACEHQKS
ncbi:hypothetical protein BV898_13399, partial [Hypsibius exemplaris]